MIGFVSICYNEFCLPWIYGHGENAIAARRMAEQVWDAMGGESHGFACSTYVVGEHDYARAVLGEIDPIEVGIDLTLVARGRTLST